jgi:subfamily B ATP-binding cassette protein MsbA
MQKTAGGSKALTMTTLLRPHLKLLIIGFIGVLGEGAANLLEPWPLKVVLDNVLHSKSTNGWLNTWIHSTFGQNPLSVLNFAALAVLAIAVVGAGCSYVEKYVTTSVGQWVTHDLRRTLYSHIQRLSLAYHDHKQTGDLISRVTGDIDSIQSFIVSGLLDAMINSLTLVGMLGVMFYLNWKFTLIAVSVAPFLFLVVFSYTRRIKKAARDVPSTSSKPSLARTTNRSAWRKKAWKASKSACAPDRSKPNYRRWSK